MVDSTSGHHPFAPGRLRSSHALMEQELGNVRRPVPGVGWSPGITFDLS
jgi:hypothetical protein